MQLWYRGTVRDIVFDTGAQSTLESAEMEVAANRRTASAAQIRARLKLVGDTQRVSIHMLRHEGEQVYAVKSNVGVRGYGWLDEVNGRPAFIVGHFVYKDWQKMRASDRNRVIAARNNYKRRHQ